MRRQQAFGLVVESEIPWPVRPAGADAHGAAVTLRRGPVDARQAAAKLLWETEIDGRPVRLERRADGGHVVCYGDTAAFGIAPGAREILVDAGPAAPGWLRFLLDTVLLIVAHLRGAELLHGAAIAVDGSAVAILGPSGAGKTTLAAALLTRGHALVADDVLALDRAGGDVVVHPGPPLVNLPRDARCAGKVVADFADESWVTVDRAATTPLALRTIVVLRRTGAGAVALSELAPSPLALLGHAIGFERSPARDRRRFNLVSDLAERVRLLHLDAGADAAPDALADAVEHALRAAPAVMTA